VNNFDQNRLTPSGQIKEIMLQGSKLGRELLRLLDDLASFYPVLLAQFLTADNTWKDFPLVSTRKLSPSFAGSFINLPLENICKSAENDGRMPPNISTAVTNKNLIVD
jgi:hypothetical protein